LARSPFARRRALFQGGSDGRCFRRAARRAPGAGADATQLEELIDKLPNSREKSIALTKLEESIMWAVKGLTADPAS